MGTGVLRESHLPHQLTTGSNTCTASPTSQAAQILMSHVEAATHQQRRRGRPSSCTAGRCQPCQAAGQHLPACPGAPLPLRQMSQHQPEYQSRTPALLACRQQLSCCQSCDHNNTHACLNARAERVHSLPAHRHQLSCCQSCEHQMNWPPTQHVPRVSMAGAADNISCTQLHTSLCRTWIAGPAAGRTRSHHTGSPSRGHRMRVRWGVSSCHPAVLPPPGRFQQLRSSQVPPVDAQLKGLSASTANTASCYTGCHCSSLLTAYCSAAGCY